MFNNNSHWGTGTHIWPNAEGGHPDVAKWGCPPTPPPLPRVPRFDWQKLKSSIVIRSEQFMNSFEQFI